MPLAIEFVGSSKPEEMERPRLLPQHRQRPGFGLSTRSSFASPPASPLLDGTFEKAFDNLVSLPSAKRKTKTISVSVSEISRPDTIDAEKANQDTSELPSYTQDWPSEPELLRWTPDNTVDVLMDIALAAAPLLLIAYAICVALLDRRPTASNYFRQHTWWGDIIGPTMMRVQGYLPTIFPMIFGIELARLAKSFALYRAERGTRLGYLEQLMGSTSFAGTFASLWGLRIFNSLGLSLLLLWSLAPLGSQMGLRIISNNGTLSVSSQVSYMNTNATPTALEGHNEDLQYYKYAVDSIFATSILAPTAQISPQDVWANVKIPSLEWLGEQGYCEADGWCYPGSNTVDDAGTYSSLTGIPVVGGIYGLGVQNFSLESSYLAFDCSKPQVTDPSIKLYSAISGSHYNTEANSSIWGNHTSSPYTFFLDTTTPLPGSNISAGDVRQDPSNFASMDLTARNIVFGSRSPNGTAISNCAITLTKVHSGVMCNFTNPLWDLEQAASGKSAVGACYVNRMRRSSIDMRPDNWTPFDESSSIAPKFFSAWPGATGLVPRGSSSPTERWLKETDPTSNTSLPQGVSRPLAAANWLGFNGETGYVDLSTLDQQTFTQRFSLLFNTYWHSFCNLQALTQTEIGLGFQAAMPENVMFNTAAIDMLLAGQHYQVNWAFLAVFVLCSCIALFAGVLAVVLKYHTLVPDVLGSVSSLTRDNPYTPVPGNGSTLAGTDFARHVMHMPVRFVDVQPDQLIGKIVMSTCLDDSQRLRSGRLYS